MVPLQPNTWLSETTKPPLRIGPRLRRSAAASHGLCPLMPPAAGWEELGGGQGRRSRGSLVQHGAAARGRMILGLENQFSITLC
jgi:hypothetical protein